MSTYHKVAAAPFAVYRIVKAKHVREAFSGEGARIAGGRWNLPGEAAVYCSATLALAALEIMVHLGEEATRLRFVSFEARIPDDQVTTLKSPPSGWRAEPPGEASMLVGSRWIRSRESVALEVPSAIVPTERNYILNPLHPNFGSTIVSRPRPFSFDSRIWR